MLKGINFLFIAIALLIFPGCSVLEGLDKSLDYVNESTTYINHVTEFAQQLPELAEQAVTDPQARTDLKNELESTKDRILAFNTIEAPAFAKDIHEKLTGYNETLLNELNGYLDKINQQVFDLKFLEDSQIVQTIDKINQTLNQIQELGQ